MDPSDEESKESKESLNPRRESRDCYNDSICDIPIGEISPKKVSRPKLNVSPDRTYQRQGSRSTASLKTPMSSVSALRTSFLSTHRPFFDFPPEYDDQDDDSNVSQDPESLKPLQNASFSDVPDALPARMRFGWFDIFLLIFSICSFLVDIITDITVAVFHYIDGNPLFFTLTVIFVATPTIIMTSISLRWYIVDSKETNSPAISKLQWTFRVFLLLLQLGPIIRYIDSLQYGLQFRKYRKSNPRLAKKYYQYMIYEDADACMLRMFEGFMEAAPQLVLQIYILALRPDRSFDWTVAVQCSSICMSLISLSWCLVSYLRILRMSLPSKRNMCWPGTLVQFLWRFCIIGSRVMTLALFASKFGHLIPWIAAGHWLVMFIWIRTMKTTFCVNACEEVVYNSVLAITFIFCFLNPIESPSRWRYSFYYTVMFAENSVLIFMWYQACDPLKWYRVPAFAGYFVAFFCGLIFMITYYLHFHPTKAIKVFRKASIQEPCEDSPEVTSMISAVTVQLETAPKPANGNAPSTSAAVTGEPGSSQKRAKVSSSHASYIKRQISEVWTTHGKLLLHPRPSAPITKH